MRIAAIGDIHGNLDNLQELYRRLEYESIDAIYHLGDIIDRGPQVYEVLQFCMEKKLKGVMGNHEGALISKHFDKNRPPKNEDKLKSYYAIKDCPGALEYLKSLPHIIVLEELQLIMVHAGVDPLKPIENQNRMCSYVSMVNAEQKGSSRWWGIDRQGNCEEENRKKGWVRWYELYDFPYHVVHGHTTHRDPTVSMFNHSPYYRVAVDTGSWYTGMLTAAIFDERGLMKFVSTPRLREPSYFEIISSS